MHKFDLNQAIKEWRQTATGRESLNPETLDELETHLLDSFDTLTNTNPNLSEQEVFLLATHRIGTMPALASEYTKVHQKQIWLGRAIHLVCGYLFISLALKTIGLEQSLAAWLGLSISAGMGSASAPFWAAGASIGTGFLALSVLVILILKFSRGTYPALAMIVNPALDKGSLRKWFGWWIGLAVFVSAASAAVRLAISHQTINAEAYGEFAYANAMYGILFQVVTLGTILILAMRFSRAYRRAQS